MSSPNHAHAHVGTPSHAHARPTGWRRWVYATNHKDSGTPNEDATKLAWGEPVAAIR